MNKQMNDALIYLSPQRIHSESIYSRKEKLKNYFLKHNQSDSTESNGLY